MQLTRFQRAAINSAAAAREHHRRTGRNYAGQLIWSDDEIAIVRRLYPDYAALEVALFPRSRQAIGAVVKRLGIAQRKNRPWTGSDLRTLRRAYLEGVHIDELVQKFGRPRRRIYEQASRCGWNRPRRPLKPTGVGIVDEVRWRAFELDISIGGLHEDAGGALHSWRSGMVRWERLERAVENLGGVFAIRWLGRSPEGLSRITTPSPVPLAEAVRRRASEIGVHLPDLARRVGAQGCFDDPGAQPQLAQIVAAVALLGGAVVIHWE